MSQPIISDLSSIEWLEELLLDFMALCSCHPRPSLLDRLASSILWLDRASSKKYPGNHTRFEEQRETELQAESVAVQKGEAARPRGGLVSQWVSRRVALKAWQGLQG